MPGDNNVDGEDRAPDAVTPGKAVPPPTVLKVDEVYEALDHPRRRYLCYALFEEVDWTLTDLAVKIAAWENDCPEHAVETDTREEVYLSLYHVHVPKLVEREVIRLDEPTERVSAGERADQVLAVFEAIADSLDVGDGG